MSLDIQVYTSTAPIIDQEDEDTYNITLVDIDETLFWGQFSFEQIAANYDFDQVLDYVHKTNDENKS